MKTDREKLQFYAAECCESQEDYEEMMAEIATYDDERCKAECIKISAFHGFAEKLKQQMDSASKSESLSDLPIVQAENDATNLMLSGTNSDTKH